MCGLCTGCEEQQEVLQDDARPVLEPSDPGHAPSDPTQESSDPIIETGSSSSSSSSSDNKPLAIGLGVGLGGAALLCLVAFTVYKVKHMHNGAVAKVRVVLESYLACCMSCVAQSWVP